MSSGIVTAGLLLAFLAIVYWAYSRSNRARFDDAAQLPLRDDAPALAQGRGECCGCGKGKHS